MFSNLSDELVCLQNYRVEYLFNYIIHIALYDIHVTKQIIIQLEY